ncbi:type VI secretion system baseplate subunit TssK [Salmonella enterica]|nr:type VI secretion system baseplate subunit TssK [Salmonella enterica]EEJ9029335.1 type VI secretion system baseplate subunit TssK [Salmonella enterica subsp. enterica]
MYSEFQQIYWYSGVYLQPQHLQALDLHHSYMLSRHRQLAQPWNFGIIQCEIDSEILIDSCFKIERLQVVMPSGDYLEYPGNCALPVKYLREIWVQREKPISLWLALRRFDPRYANVGNKPSNRWINTAEEIMMKDVYFDGPECSISRILYNVQILTEDEAKSTVGCDLLPLAQLRCDNNRVYLDSDFCAPLLDIHSSPVLSKLLNGLYSELSCCIYKFDEIFLNSNNNINQLIATCALNRTLPLLQHYLQTPTMHPWIIFGTLLQIIGEIKSLQRFNDLDYKINESTHNVEKYDHYHIMESFLSLKKQITTLINKMHWNNYTTVLLTADDRGGYSAELPMIPKKHTVLLSLHSDSMTSDVFPESSDFKVATISTISALIRHALPGITLSIITSEPKNIPKRKAFFYFKLDKHGSLWEQVEQQKNICFYWGNAPVDLQVQLIIMEEI